jgi:hypothetical protein
MKQLHEAHLTQVTQSMSRTTLVGTWMIAGRSISQGSYDFCDQQVSQPIDDARSHVSITVGNTKSMTNMSIVRNETHYKLLISTERNTPASRTPTVGHRQTHSLSENNIVLMRKAVDSTTMKPKKCYIPLVPPDPAAEDADTADEAHSANTSPQACIAEHGQLYGWLDVHNTRFCSCSGRRSTKGNKDG